MRNWIARLALLTVLLAAPFAAKAQDSSSMTGTVTDATGAVVPGTTIVLSNKLTGVKYTQTTDGKGSYRFANVPPAQGYTVQFARDGFSTVTVDSVALSVGITRTQDVKLTAGSDVKVEVSAASQQVTINTTDASIGNNFSVTMLNDLPVYDRAAGVSTLFALQPGAANVNGTYSFVGARTDQNSVTVDGIDVNDVAAGGNLSIVGYAPIDSVEEFRGVITGLVPSVGTGSGAEFQLVTKGGTNKFHGNLNEYHRDTATEANTWFNNNVGLPRTPLIRNQFGGSIGGPIKKDKAFFFFDFNDSRIIQSGSAERTVPLDNYRNGTVDYIYANQGGISSGAACGATSRQNTTPTCIGTANTPQLQALDPQGKGFSSAILSFITTRYPHANDLNSGDGVNTGGFRFTEADPDFLTNYVGRVDYNLTPHQRVFARLTIARRNAFEALNFLPTDPITSPYIDRSYGYVVSHIWEIGAHKVNQFYYGDNISKYSFPNNYNPTGALQFTLGGLSGPYTSGSSQKRRVPIPEVRDDFNWQIGAHNLGFGGQFKFIKTNSNLTNDFSFVGIGIGGLTPNLNASLRPANIRGGTTAPTDWDSAFTAALGRIADISSNYNFNNAGQPLSQDSGENRAYRYYETEAYLGDTWKVTKKLTLSYGLRYQFYSVPYETHGDESIQNLTFNQLFTARVNAGLAGQSGDTVAPLVTYNLGGKANNAAPLYNPSYKDFAPRFALAYQAAPHTVFNMSAALVYDRTVINAINFIQDQSSFLFQNNTARNYGQTIANNALLSDPRIQSNLSLGPVTLPVAPAITTPYTPYVSGTTPYGGSSGAGYSEIVDPTLKDPYSISLNAGVQQEFKGGFIMRLNYAGRLGRRLLAQADASQVVDFVDPASKQAYSAAFGNVTQQLRNGTASYAVTAQPWFENQLPAGIGAFYGYSNNTQFIVDNDATQVLLGDIADFANFMLENGVTANNVNVGAQFALNPWVTNKGFSSYNGLLFTLSKNLSHGVQFDFNYTLSHSMDNASAPANYIAANSLINFICDATNLRKCRGNSDFDVQNSISSNFIADLPVGRGKMFASHAPLFLEELIGGWSVSGIPQWHSGLALGTVSNAFGASFNEDEPAFFNGNRGAVGAHTHKTSTGAVQMFSNQTTALSTFSGPIGLQFGSRNNLRGPSYFDMDAGLAKKFIIVSNKVDLKFRADFFNILNHPSFGLPTSDITSSNFGVISSTVSSSGTNGGARVGQFSLRLEF